MAQTPNRTNEQSSSTEPVRSLEVEVTFDASSDTQLPDWTQLAEIVDVAGPEIRDLDAQYFDTATGTLARAGFAVRRRTGGPDAGWHIKGPIVDGARTEAQWPLESAAGIREDGSVEIPAAVTAEIASITQEALVPLARIRNERHAFSLRDAQGNIVAEMVDDHVHAVDGRDGTVRQWREWELELGPAAPADSDARSAFFAAAQELAFAAGAGPAASASKLARALGH